MDDRKRSQTLWIVIAVIPIAIAAVFLMFRHTKPQPGDVMPGDMVSLAIYDMDGLGEVNAQEMASLAHVTIQGEDLRTMLSQFQWDNGSPAWKGSFFGVALLQNGRQCTVAISYYGGFFRVHGQRGYFVLQGESRRAWDSALKRALSEVFLPVRTAALGVHATEDRVPLRSR